MNEQHPFTRIDPRLGGATFTHAELDALMKRLRAIGSPYDYIALCVERDNRPRCK
jgi:hypothetical protein